MDELFKDRDEFAKEVISLAETKGMDYMEAIIDICNRTGLDVETAATLVKDNVTIRARLREEGENQGLLVKLGRLPL